MYILTYLDPFFYLLELNTVSDRHTFAAATINVHAWGESMVHVNIKAVVLAPSTVNAIHVSTSTRQFRDQLPCDRHRATPTSNHITRAYLCTRCKVKCQVTQVTSQRKVVLGLWLRLWLALGNLCYISSSGNLHHLRSTLLPMYFHSPIHTCIM